MSVGEGIDGAERIEIRSRSEEFDAVAMNYTRGIGLFDSHELSRVCRWWSLDWQSKCERAREDRGGANSPTCPESVAMNSGLRDPLVPVIWAAFELYRSRNGETKPCRKTSISDSSFMELSHCADSGACGQGGRRSHLGYVDAIHGGGGFKNNL